MSFQRLSRRSEIPPERTGTWRQFSERARPTAPLARLSHPSMISSVTQSFGGLDRCFGADYCSICSAKVAPPPPDRVPVLADVQCRAAPANQLRGAAPPFGSVHVRRRGVHHSAERSLRQELLFCRAAARRRRLCS